MSAPRTLLGFPDWEPAALLDLVDLARDLKGGRARGHLGGRVVVLYFANPSLRTRASVEAACARLGATAVVLDAGAGGVWGLEHRDGVVMDGTAAEHVKEAARVLSRYGDAIGVRAFAGLKDWGEDRTEPLLSAFARHATVPVFSLEGSARHPLQGLADAQTILERLPDPRGQKLVLTWAPHFKPLPMAVPNSVVETGALLGMDVVVARPEAMALDPEVLAAADALARARGGSVRETSDRQAALEGARVVYAKSWGALRHYGDWEAEKPLRAQENPRWVVRAADLERGADPFFMHCLPVRRNLKVEDAVLDGPRSAVIQQAENRLWTAQAVLLRLLDGGVSRQGREPSEDLLIA
ncbi:MAG: N-acetylornithine carbamoyltransferase [Planctomycetes bacterium]|nr:N-acetylornithine carbamoyltransferase [Planctomycetota bacterium]